MSQTEHRTLKVNETEQANRLNAPLNPPLTNQNLEKRPEFAEGSGPLFLMYRKMTEEEDKKMVERWQKDAEGIIIFTGLLSAAVAAVLAMTVGSLDPSFQDGSVLILQNIYLLLVKNFNANETLPSDPMVIEAFTPPKYAVWVSGILFLSLAINLSCAMMATLIRQWARRYLRITQSPRYSLHERARIRAFFANGVDVCWLPQVIEGIPVLIEVSLFLFFSGLLTLLASMHSTVFLAVFWLPLMIFCAYVIITIMPLVRHDSPYYSWYSSFMGFLGHVEKLAVETVQKRASEIDNHIFKWIFDNLVEDHDSEVAQFFESISSSSILQEPLLSLTNLGEGKLSSALSKFLERTWLSNFVPGSDKMRRLVVCVKIADVASLSDLAMSILEDILLGTGIRCYGPLKLGDP
ncbi:hypothetical protein BJV78DRAFT_412285 [Lactifluus subvellereus]|nr:hypothetical protein BJV78DRAFT_412285 [Lactifluus subvellereus]